MKAGRAGVRSRRAAVLALLLAVPLPALPIAPGVLALIKQIVQQSATSMIKDALLGSVSGMGCKGTALTSAIGALDARGGARALLSQGAALPAAHAQLGELMRGGALPGGATLDAEQRALLERMQVLLGAPASPAETRATLDELAQLGLLPNSLRSELDDCMTLLPQSAEAMGMAVGVFRSVLPQLRQAREQLHALPPEDQDQLVETIAQELKDAPADERKLFVESVGGGFFPPRVVEALRARLAR